MQKVSKSQFKPKALEWMRQVEKTGESIIITDHGKPRLEIKVYRDHKEDPLTRLKGSVLYYTDPTEPVADEDWTEG